jgi:hypothetical protein
MAGLRKPFANTGRGLRQRDAAARSIRSLFSLNPAGIAGRGGATRCARGRAIVQNLKNSAGF